MYVFVKSRWKTTISHAYFIRCTYVRVYVFLFFVYSWKYENLSSRWAKKEILQRSTTQWRRAKRPHIAGCVHIYLHTCICIYVYTYKHIYLDIKKFHSSDRKWKYGQKQVNSSNNCKHVWRQQILQCFYTTNSNRKIC